MTFEVSLTRNFFVIPFLKYKTKNKYRAVIGLYTAPMFPLTCLNKSTLLQEWRVIQQQ